jgi:hypothetical protein
MPPIPSESHRLDESGRNGHQEPPIGEPPRPPRQSSSPGGPAMTDLPPVRRMFVFLYLVAGFCVLLAAVLWWQILR